MVGFFFLSYRPIRWLQFVVVLCCSGLAVATGWTADSSGLCHAIAARLSSVPAAECLARKLVASSGTSVSGRPLLLREHGPLPGKTPQAKVLLIGGMHGDEYTSISLIFAWMRLLERYHSGLFHWRIVPLLNPDGLLHQPSQRVNEHGVDLNRNFPTRDWQTESLAYWQQKTQRDSRRYPGSAAMVEPESRWLAEEIRAFAPDVIVSVHAPLGVVDFDGPARVTPPRKLGPLPLRPMGTYPGSLGRYAGEEMGIPVLTIELASATRMLSPADSRKVWGDLISWLRLQVKNH
ncbi:MAG: murein peptide amidase A [Magnetococcales bacterium]|nr:murein peptide amidase A [Magnetococcales bacterium]